MQRQSPKIPHVEPRELLYREDLDPTHTNQNGQNAFEIYHHDSIKDGFVAGSIEDEGRLVRSYMERYQTILLSRKYPPPTLSNLKLFELRVALKFLITNTNEKGYFTISESDVEKYRKASNELIGLTKNGPIRSFFLVIRMITNQACKLGFHDRPKSDSVTSPFKTLLDSGMGFLQSIPAKIQRGVTASEGFQSLSESSGPNQPQINGFANETTPLMNYRYPVYSDYSQTADDNYRKIK